MTQVEEQAAVKAEQDNSMARLVGILAENGVTGIYAWEAGESKATNLPCVSFEAPENDYDEYGNEIAKIALEHGYPVCTVMRRWNYHNNKFYRPRWKIEFMRDVPQSKFDGYVQHNPDNPRT